MKHLPKAFSETGMLSVKFPKSMFRCPKTVAWKLPSQEVVKKRAKLAQQGPIENLLEGLDQHTQFLSKEELEAELRNRGINVDEFLKRAHDMIDANKTLRKAR